MEDIRQEQTYSEAGRLPHKPVLFAVLAGVVWCAVLYASVSLALFTAPAVAALAAAAMCRLGERPGARLLLPLLPPLLALPLVWPGAGGVIAVLMLPATALAIWLLQKRRLGGFLTATACAVLAIAALYALVCLPGILDGTGAFAAAQAVVAEAGEFLLQGLAPLRNVAGYAEEIQMLEKLCNAIYLAVPSLLIGMLCLLGAGIGFFAVVLFFACTRAHRDACGIAAPKPFRFWSIPKRYTIGIVLLYGTALLLYLFGYANAEAVYNTVSALLGFPLLVQGLALVAFLLSLRKKRSVALSVIVFTIIGVLFPLTYSMLSTVGLFDQFIRFRERELPPVAPQHGV